LQKTFAKLDSVVSRALFDKVDRGRRVVAVTRGRKAWRLPFCPPLSSNEIKLADLLRDKRTLWSRDIERRVKGHKFERLMAGHLYKLHDKDDNETRTLELIDHKHPLAPSMMRNQACGKNYHFDLKYNFRCLHDGHSLYDEVLTASYRSEYDIYEQLPKNYNGSFIFKTPAINQFCFRDGKQFYDPSYLNKSLLYRNGSKKGELPDGEQRYPAAVDIFENISRVIFPLNERNYH
jgi:hypothetical protein